MGGQFPSWMVEFPPWIIEEEADHHRSFVPPSLSLLFRPVENVFTTRDSTCNGTCVRAQAQLRCLIDRKGTPREAPCKFTPTRVIRSRTPLTRDTVDIWLFWRHAGIHRFEWTSTEQWHSQPFHFYGALLLRDHPWILLFPTDRPKLRQDAQELTDARLKQCSAMNQKYFIFCQVYPFRDFRDDIM